MITTQLGTDISWWNGVVDFVKMKAAGAFYVIIRAGSVNSKTGNLYTDYAVATYAPDAEEAGLPKGFYWYYREFGYEHAKKQARFFWETIRGWTIEEGLFCDVEVYNGKLRNVLAFMEELQRVSGLPDDLLGIYSRALLWNALEGDHRLFARFLNWVARYTSRLHPWSDAERMRMQPWQEPNYHQHSADGNGRGAEFGAESNAMDINRKFIYGEQPPPTDRAKVEILHEGPVDITVKEIV